MTRPLILLLLSVALPVAAQTPVDLVAWERFFPAAVGDTWTYTATENVFCGTTTWTTTVEVIGEPTVDGDRVPRFRTRRSGYPGELELERWVRASTGDVWFTTSGDPSYWPLDQNPFSPPTPLFVFTNDVPASPTAVMIGGETESVSAVKTFSASDTRSDIQQRFAADVGLLYYRRYYDSSGCARRTVTYQLQYARVGGVEYGTPLVAAEGGPGAAAGLGLAVAPNPVGATAALSLALPEAGAARVEVRDLLGRVVLRRDLGAQPAGASEHTLDTSALAPGVYVLRALTPDGVATRRFTRAD